MSLRIQTNAAAINSHRQLQISDNSMASSLEKLSSGYRINRAADDAAGLSMSNKFAAQISGLNVASRNASQANSLLQIAEGGMDQIGNILTRLKELSTQAASANNSQNLTDINAEAAALTSEIDRISNSTTFQGTSLLTGFGTKTATNTLTAANAYGLDISGSGQAVYSVTTTDGTTITMKDMATSVTQTLAKGAGASTYNFTSFGVSFKTNGAADQSAILAGVVTDLASLSVSTSNADFQIGETNGTNYRISFSITSSTTTALSVTTSTVDLSSAAGAKSAMDYIDAAIGTLNSARASIGATQNRLGYTSANLATAIENASSANSVIKDVDMASEMTSFTKNQILVQAGTAMLAQANQSPQLILSLLK
jgi:flagellin